MPARGDLTYLGGDARGNFKKKGGSGSGGGGGGEAGDKTYFNHGSSTDPMSVSMIAAAQKREPSPARGIT